MRSATSLGEEWHVPIPRLPRALNPSLPRRRSRAGAALHTFSTEPLIQEHELTRCEDWTPEAIEERRLRLASFAVRRWAIPEHDPLEADPSDDNEPESGEDLPGGVGMT
jgi:hypothetical protein